jgi:uncharacterized repeat protein (TIGR03803 family)
MNMSLNALRNHFVHLIKHALICSVGVFGLTSAWTSQAATQLEVLQTFGQHDGHPSSTPVSDASGNLYGTTRDGGDFNQGTLYRIDTTGARRVLYSFDGSHGAHPNASPNLVGNVLFGTTTDGGSSSQGTLYKYDVGNAALQVLQNFDGTNGANPYSSPILINNVLYGATLGGGSANQGTFYKFDLGSSAAVIQAFSFDGSQGAGPQSALTRVGNSLYGTAAGGGASGNGTLYKFDLTNANAGIQLLSSFDGSNGNSPSGGVTLIDNALYGTASSGGASSNGTIYKFDLNNTAAGLQAVAQFDGAHGAVPLGELTAVGKVLYGTTNTGLASTRPGTIFKFDLNNQGAGAQLIQTFDSNYGTRPNAGLTLVGSTLFGTTSQGSGSDGTLFKYDLNNAGLGLQVAYTFRLASAAQPNAIAIVNNVLYGTSFAGGAGFGTFFQLDLGNGGAGGQQVLQNFDSSHGEFPYPPELTLVGTSIYGTTNSGGTSGSGTIYKFDLNNSGAGLQVVQNFDSAHGAHPTAGLTLVNNLLFGTTYNGGLIDSGTIYNIDPANAGAGINSLYSFANVGTSSGHPLGGLTQVGNILYGTTSDGGAGDGTLFKYDLGNASLGVQDLQAFDFSNGRTPYAEPVVVNNVLYGTTNAGGTSDYGTLYKYDLNNTSAGLQVIQHFDYTTFGAGPTAPLTQIGQVLYGTTSFGGSNGTGTIFKYDLNNTNAGVQTLYHFDGVTGARPYARLIAVNNILYGATMDGGPAGGGTLFRFTLASKASSSTTLKVEPSAPVVRQVLTLLAKVNGNNPTGAVSFYDGTSFLGSANLREQRMATFTSNKLSIGKHSLTAKYAGDAKNEASASAAVSVVVAPRPR